MAEIKKLILHLDMEQFKKGIVDVKGKLNEIPKTTTTKMTGDSTSLKNSISDAQKSIANMAAGVFAATRVWGTFVSTLNQSIENARAQVIATKMLESQLLATGNAAGISAGRLGELASELQNVSNMGDDAITQNLTVPLTSFKNISGPIFERTMKAILDLNAVIGDPNNPSSLRGVTIQLGKALNDPITGLTMLSRSGVSFTEAQKETIKSLVETNRLFEAQAVILDEMDAQFGGAAAAAVNSSIQMKNAWGDMLESMGMATLPALDGINTAFSNFFLLLAEQYGAAFSSQQEAMLASFKTANDFATGLALNTTALADFIVGSVAYAQSAISGLSKTARTAISEMFDQAWKLSESLPTAVANAVTGAWDWSHVKDIIGGVGSGLEEVSAQVQNTNNEMQMNLNFMLNGFKEYDKNFSDITQKSTQAYQKQFEIRKKLQQDMEGSSQDDQAGGGGESKAVAKAATEYEKLLEQLKKYHTDAQLEELSAQQKQLAEIEIRYEKELGIIDAAEKNKEITTEEALLRKQELESIYDSQRISAMQKNYEALSKINAEAAAKIKADVDQYYNGVKFADSGYFSWKKAQIKAEVEAMAISDSQKKVLYDQLRTQLEADRDASMASSKEKGSWFFNGLLGFDPSSPGDQEKIAAIKSTFSNLQSSVGSIVQSMLDSSRTRRDEELAMIDATAEREKWQQQDVLAAKQKVNAKYAQEERKLKNIQKGLALATATINTAESVTKALTLGPILGPIMAIIVGAFGAVQIGVIANQKFAQGGKIFGNSHASGGVTIEAEGGEYIVNKESTKRHLPLLEAINSPRYETGGLINNISVPSGITRRSGASAFMPSPGVSGYSDDIGKKLDAINLNLSRLELNVTVNNNAPDIDTRVEAHEIAKARNISNGKGYSYAI